MKRIKLKDLIKEYAPSDPVLIDKAVAAIKRLGVRNPLRPQETLVNNNVMIEISNWDKRLWISTLQSLEKGVGNATKVMYMMCKIADKYNVTMALDPSPYGKDPNKLNYSQLVQFYKKFGFKFDEGEEGFGDMERLPAPRA
jgi:hypothetical protein